MSAKPTEYIFLLVENFSHMPFSCALEAFRIANLAAERELYSWRLASENGADASSSNGTVTRVDMGLDNTSPDAHVIVVAGLNAKHHSSPAVEAWLRWRKRFGSGKIGAICCGSYILAEAGLMGGRRCALHWEYHDAFMEDHPDVDLSTSVFVKDGRFFSASGGAAATDLALSLIEEDHGSDLSRNTAERLVYASVRSEQDGQRASYNSKIGARNPRLARAMEIMETDLDEPMKSSDIASEVGMSTRQLERLFGRYLNCSPKKYRMELRLARARTLLRQTELSVINVALACGFTSPSHFSRCYRTRYGETPYSQKTS
ncbi:MAG: GlxA family transcriptional regulator [Pikeienuella sp.]